MRRLRYRVTATGRKKTMALHVHRDGTVEVRAPRFVGRLEIRRFVEKRSAWIAERRRYFEKLKREYPPKELKNGESFPLFGRNLRLRIERRPGLKLFRGLVDGRRLKVLVNGQQGVDLKNAIWSALRDFYSALTERCVRAAIRKHAPSLAVKPRGIKVVEQKGRWGSCSRAGDLRFNWRLSMMPLPVLEYVAVHELCHLKIHDHSPRFWRYVKSVLPGVEKQRSRLKAQAHVLKSLASD